MSRELTLENITPRVKQVVEYYLANPTLTHDAIGKALTLSRSRVSHILSNPRVTRLYPLLARRTVRERILPKAMQAYEQLIDQKKNPAVREKAAGRILSSEKVLDNESTLRVEGQITFKGVRELSEIVKKAKNLPEPYLDAEIVDDLPSQGEDSRRKE